MPNEDWSATLKRQRAYRDANRHVVSAGILLATMGVPKDAPEMQALRAALRAVNQAGGIEEPKPKAAATQAPAQAQLRKEMIRVFPTEKGSRPGRQGGAA